MKHSGALVLSLDFELHWGVHDIYSPDGPYRKNLLGVWEAIPRMLDLFETCDIAATWATVGFLFATSRQELEAYTPALRPAYLNRKRSPYGHIIGDSEKDDPLHFAPSLIKAIAHCPRQEIATHTFSHYYCLEPGQTVDEFKADMHSAIAIAHHHGYKIRSIIFPRNQANPQYLNVLRDIGIVCYRGLPHSRLTRFGGMRNDRKLWKRLLRRLDWHICETKFNLVSWNAIKEPNGLCNVRGSRVLRPYEEGRSLSRELHFQHIARSIEAAAVSNKIFHLWWHPHNFGTNIDENISFLQRILTFYDKCRQKYGMRSLTMYDVSQIATSSVQDSSHL